MVHEQLFIYSEQSWNGLCWLERMQQNQRWQKMRKRRMEDGAQSGRRMMRTRWREESKEDCFRKTMTTRRQGRRTRKEWEGKLAPSATTALPPGRKSRAAECWRRENYCKEETEGVRDDPGQSRETKWWREKADNTLRRKRRGAGWNRRRRNSQNNTRDFWQPADQFRAAEEWCWNVTAVYRKRRRRRKLSEWFL